MPARRVSDVMSASPVTLSAKSTVEEAAEAMRDSDIGDIVVVDDGERLFGIVTDRDIVVRAIAEGEDPAETTLAEICSGELVTIAPDEALDEAIRLMREHAVRRLIVVKDDKPVGVLSLGDLAIAKDRESALGEISAAPPSH